MDNNNFFVTYQAGDPSKAAGMLELKLSVLRAHRVPSGPRQSATGSRPPSGRFRNQQRDLPIRQVIEILGSHPRIPFVRGVSG